MESIIFPPPAAYPNNVSSCSGTLKQEEHPNAIDEEPFCETALKVLIIWAVTSALLYMLGAALLPSLALATFAGALAALSACGANERPLALPVQNRSREIVFLPSTPSAGSVSPVSSLSDSPPSVYAILSPTIPNATRKLVFGNAGAAGLQQASPAPKQAMCKHMADTGGCKHEDAGAAKNQFSSCVLYKQPSLASPPPLSRTPSPTVMPPITKPTYLHRTLSGRFLSSSDSHGHKLHGLHLDLSRTRHGPSDIDIHESSPMLTPSALPLASPPSRDNPPSPG